LLVKLGGFGYGPAGSMKITGVRIKNFKALEDLSLQLVGQDGVTPRPVTLVLGDNGSGKTTLLQAIALTLSLATRDTQEPAKFEWPGFLAERVGSLGTSRVELDVVFDTAELAATKRLHERWAKRVTPERRASLAPPEGHGAVMLVYESGALSSPQGEGAISQFLGRFFLRSLEKTDPSVRSVYPQIGGVFWFDQQRNLSTIRRGSRDGVEGLRSFLVEWYAHHKSERVTLESDYLQRLEELFARFFPGARFVGTELRAGEFAPGEQESYFLIERHGRVYDLAEMSSGEQAVFPLLYEFIQRRIARSIVLVDELELHLHPPQQQRLMTALRRIGPDCQFIVTSHSPYLEQITPDEDEIRLEGGQRCL